MRLTLKKFGERTMKSKLLFIGYCFSIFLLIFCSFKSGEVEKIDFPRNNIVLEIGQMENTIPIFIDAYTNDFKKTALTNLMLKEGNKFVDSLPKLFSFYKFNLFVETNSNYISFKEVVDIAEIQKIIWDNKNGQTTSEAAYFYFFSANYFLFKVGYIVETDKNTLGIAVKADGHVYISYSEEKGEEVVFTPKRKSSTSSQIFSRPEKDVMGGVIFTSAITNCEDMNTGNTEIKRAYKSMCAMAHELGHWFSFVHTHDYNISDFYWPPGSTNKYYVDILREEEKWHTIMYYSYFSEFDMVGDLGQYPKIRFYFCQPYSNTLLNANFYLNLDESFLY